jgi:hypothetical protein
MQVSSQTIELSMTTSTYWGQHTPRNAMAAWLFDVATYSYIKTFWVNGSIVGVQGMPYVDSTRRSLINWEYASKKDTADAVTGATFKGHGTRKIFWDCKDKSGQVVPDANYMIWLEMTETNSFRDPSWPAPSKAITIKKSAIDTVYTAITNMPHTDQWDFNPYGKGFNFTVGKNFKAAYYAPQAGDVQFSSPMFVTREGKAAITVTVTRTKGRTGAIAVSYATKDSTALAGSDYTAKTGTVSFADGVYAPQTISIDVTDDNAKENAEFAIIELSSPTNGAKLGAVSRAVLAIYDNDGTIPENGLAANWNFDEGAGDMAYDASGNGNHGVVYETKWNKVGMGSAIAADTNQAWIDVGAGASLNCKGAVTVSAWIYPKKDTDPTRMFQDTSVTKIDSTKPVQVVLAEGQYGIDIIPATKQVHFGYKSYGVTTAANTLTYNAWNHVACVFSGNQNDAVSAANAKIFINGASVTVTASGTWASLNAPYGMSALAGPGFTGMLDGMYIYNRALTDAEIAAIYANNPTPVEFSTTRLTAAQEPLFVSVNRLTHTATIRMPALGAPADVKIFNTSGKQVRGMSGVRTQAFEVKTDGLASGIYMICVKTVGKQLSAKMFLKK